MILSLADHSRKAYRIGGDEFILVIEHPQEGEVEALLKRLEELKEFKSDNRDMEISIAYGYAYGQGKKNGRHCERGRSEHVPEKEGAKRERLSCFIFP